MFQQPPFGKNDIESGNPQQLYPYMIESPQMRWAFIRKVYLILTTQMLLTVAVAAAVVFIKPIPHFFTHSKTGLAVYIVLIILPFIILCPLYYYHKKHPVNLILLALFTIAISFPVGLSCAFTEGKIVLLAAILTAAVAISLTVYTFYAVKRGKDFSFLGPILFAAVIVLILFGFIQMIFPLGKTTHTVFAALGAIIFAAYIVYDTDNLIKRHTYDEYIWASVSLYLDILNLFMSLLNLLRAVA